MCSHHEDGWLRGPSWGASTGLEVRTRNVFSLWINPAGSDRGTWALCLMLPRMSLLGEELKKASTESELAASPVLVVQNAPRPSCTSGHKQKWDFCSG